MKYQINLLPKKEQATVDKITYFALHYLRYILVITQLVAIGVFFYRFKVDQEIVDLKDTLNQKKAIVDNTKMLLSTVEELDGKIGSVKKFYTKQETFHDQTSYVLQKIPSGILTSSLDIGSSDITLSGKSPDIASIRLLYDDLKNEKKFKNVSLSNVNKQGDGFSFNLKLFGFVNKNGS
jgi:hypothetical protein